jgi:hypothetical protein
MPELTLVGPRACEQAERLAPHLVAAFEEFLPQNNRQIIREFDGGVLVVTAQQPDSDVQQLAFFREDIPGLPEVCKTMVHRWLADQEKRDARGEAEKN